MNEIVQYKRTEEYQGLVGELVSATVEFRKIQAMTTAEYKFEVAGIITAHPAYQRFGKGNQQFILDLVADVNQLLSSEEYRIQKSTVYELLAVKAKFGTLENATQAVMQAKKNPYIWESYLVVAGIEKHKKIPPPVETSRKQGIVCGEHDCCKKLKALLEKKTKEPKPKKFPDPSVQDVMQAMYDFFGLKHLDGSQEMNRRYAYLAVQKYGLPDVLKGAKNASEDPFWKSRITSVKDLYYKLERFINQKSQPISKVWKI